MIKCNILSDRQSYSILARSLLVCKKMHARIIIDWTYFSPFIRCSSQKHRQLYLAQENDTKILFRLIKAWPKKRELILISTATHAIGFRLHRYLSLSVCSVIAYLFVNDTNRGCSQAHAHKTYFA